MQTTYKRNEHKRFTDTRYTTNEVRAYHVVPIIAPITLDPLHVTPALFTLYPFRFVQKFIKEYTLLSNSGKNILLCWIPSHTGIRGNEKADTAVKAALSLAAHR